MTVVMANKPMPGTPVSERVTARSVAQWVSAAMMCASVVAAAVVATAHTLDERGTIHLGNTDCS